MVTHTPKILSLFTGTGGLDLGFKLALPKSRTVCFVEREAYAVAVLARRMREGVMDDAPVWSDITTFDGRPWRGKIHCILGGFPCQPFSVAGPGKKKKDERWLWADIERILREVEPGSIFLENVPGLANGGLEVVLATLATLGFDVAWGLFSAEQVGAPHLRQRLFIFGQMGNAYRLPASHLLQSKVDRESGFPNRSLGFIKGSNFFPPRPGKKKNLAFRKSLYKPGFFDQIDGDAARLGKSKEECWVDQARAMGNGVVPQSAALAFTILQARLNSL